MVEEQLCAEIKKSVVEGFASLTKVRGNVFLIRSILRAIKRKERELSRDLDQKTMCLDIYCSMFAAPACTAEEKRMVVEVFKYLDETDQPLVEVVGIMKRGFNAIRRCFWE
jgi:hypothetical protein